MKYLKSIGCRHGNGISVCGDTHEETGLRCPDCGRFVKIGTLEYFMTGGLVDAAIIIHNMCVGQETPKELSELSFDLTENDTYINSMTEADANKFWGRTNDLFTKYFS